MRCKGKKGPRLYLQNRTHIWLLTPSTTFVFFFSSKICIWMFNRINMRISEIKHVNHLSKGRRWTYFSSSLHLFLKNSSPYSFPVFIHFQWSVCVLVVKVHFMTSECHVTCLPQPPNAFHTLLWLLQGVFDLLFWEYFSDLDPLVSIWLSIYNFDHIYWHLVIHHFVLLLEYLLPMCALYSWLLLKSRLYSVVSRLHRDCWMDSGHSDGEENIHWRALKEDRLGSWGKLKWFPYKKWLRNLGHPSWRR